jgi:hypothetical protein
MAPTKKNNLLTNPYSIKSGPEKKGKKKKNKKKNGLKLTKCGRDYISALCDPFEAEPTCLPNSFNLPSRKVKAWTKSVMTVGTSGFGFVTSRPCSGSDTPAVSASGPTFAGIVMNGAAFGTFQTTYNSPYFASEFGTAAAAARWRVVGHGLRIKYIGKVLDANGQVALKEHPDHDGWGTTGFYDLQSYAHVQTYATAECGEWRSVTYTPKHYDDGLWQTDSAAFPEEFLAIAVEATAGDLYAFEAFELFETVGKDIKGRTASVVNPPETSIITAAFNTVSTSDLIWAADKAGQVALPFIQKYVMNYFLGGPIGTTIPGQLRLEL